MTTITSHQTKRGTYSHEEGSPCGICDALHDRIHTLEVKLAEEEKRIAASRALVVELNRVAQDSTAEAVALMLALRLEGVMWDWDSTEATLKKGAAVLALNEAEMLKRLECKEA